MDKSLHSTNADLHRASALMTQALDMLDRADETRAATHLQHALDTLNARLGSPVLPDWSNAH